MGDCNYENSQLSIMIEAQNGYYIEVCNKGGTHNLVS